MKKDAVLEIERWRQAEQHRDQLQAQLDWLDVDPASRWTTGCANP